MKLTFYGGSCEVGRSCIEVKTTNSKILLDAGLQITETGGEYPLVSSFEGYDAVAVTHGHLDHIGALPLFNYKGLSCPIYCTKMAKVISKILLKDSYHVEILKHLSPAYNEKNVFSILDLMKMINYREPVNVKGDKILLFNSGHIPGSSSILVEAEGKRILYTGDLNTNETNLLSGANTDYGKIDVLICESTYGDHDHPIRSEEEARFIKSIKDIIFRGGSVLVPAFAVARSQEILMILTKEKFNVPIYLDGMAKKVLARILEHPEFIKDINMLKQAIKKVHIVKGRKERERITYKPGIFVSPSGMIDGGPVLDYLKEFWHKEDSGLFLTGYQAEGTNGRLISENKEFFINGSKLKVKCQIEKFDFSAHAGMTQLHDYIQKVNPRLLVLNHGDPKALEALGDWAMGEGFEVKIPKNGDSITV